MARPDEFGHKAVENVVTVQADLRDEILHLLGMDHERAPTTTTDWSDGRTHGTVVCEILG